MDLSKWIAKSCRFAKWEDLRIQDPQVPWDVDASDMDSAPSQRTQIPDNADPWQDDISRCFVLIEEGEYATASALVVAKGPNRDNFLDELAQFSKAHGLNPQYWDWFMSELNEPRRQN